MSFAEQIINFDCAGERLLGILAKPSDDQVQPAVGVVVIVGGPQYRAGSHRQFVLLSRALAAAGYPALRFDYRGMGDSTGDKRDFLGVTPDIGAAIDAMQQWLPTLQHVVLWGLCDGASAALLYCQATGDTRVTGLCLLNPWIRSEASLARTQVKHYYTQRMRQKEFWQKLLSGQVAMGAARGFMRNIRVAAMRPSRRAADSGTAPPFQTQMAMGWLRFGGPIELILSGDDYTAKEFLEYCAGNPLWSEALAQAQVRRHDIAGADHTYSNVLDRMKVEARTIQMLSQCSRPRT